LWVRDLLDRLGFAGDDAHDLATAEPTDKQRELIARRRVELVARMGSCDWFEGWPFDPDAPWTGVWTFLAALPDVRAYHRAIDVADDVSWATLADLGRHAAIDRILHGNAGLRNTAWLSLHFRGGIYQLGRLQFQTGDELEIHIPAGGPLSPEACDASFAQAAAFFGGRTAVCTSWLLDPALADYLPADSNIVRFGRRFELRTAGPNAYGDILRFVFHRLDADLDELPQGTTLERALVTHLRRGGQWRRPTGWLSVSGGLAGPRRPTNAKSRVEARRTGGPAVG
jgi:GNAT-like C-terminal domain/N-acyltransferase N-terminal domain